MTVIKTNKMELKREAHDVVSAKFAMQEIHIKFADGILLIIPWYDDSESNKLNLVLNMFKDSKAQNVTLDFTDPQQMLKIG